MSKPVLQLKGITRVYKTAHAELNVLNGANLNLKAGEIVGLVGPSGSGKSSLLHAAGLLERPDGGRIEINGEDCTDWPDRKRTGLRRSALGFVYQFHHLLAEFTALDNAAMPLLIAGVGQNEARNAAREILTTLGLGERLDHQPGALSGGEQQRVAIARALVHKPAVVLADEPTGNLDPDTTTRVFQAFVDAARAGGTAALIATHNLDLVQHMDRAVTLRDGVLTAYSN